MRAAQALQRAYLRVHQALYERSGGLVGHRLAGTPSLLLTTVGRRSGRPRTAALIYARDGADLVLVASNHGLDDPPAWFLNVGANPMSVCRSPGGGQTVTRAWWPRAIQTTHACGGS